MLDVRENEMRTGERKPAARILWLAMLALSCAWPAFSQSAPPEKMETSSVEGMVRDGAGKPVACATVVLTVVLVEGGDAKAVEGRAVGTKAVGTKALETKSTGAGMFFFSGLHGGEFTVAVQKAGSAAVASRSIELSAGEKKHVELVLDSPSAASVAAGHAATAGCYADALQFSDQPNFVIAGVTDWSNLGLHGSDAAARTSEALAKETLALKSNTRESSADSSTSVAVAHRVAGDRYERSNDPVAAVREYEQAAQLDGSEENYLAWGGELLLHRAATPAAEVFGKGFALHAKSARLLTGLGAAMYANGSPEEAARRLCEAADLDPADSAPYVFLGKIQEAASGPLPCAGEKLERFAREQPENALANYYYAISVWKRMRPAGSSVGASSVDANSVDANSANGSAVDGSARASSVGGSAVDGSVKAKSVDANSVDGSVKDSSAEFRKAEALLEKAVAIDPAFAEAYLALGSLYSAQGEFARAQEFLRKAISINPSLGEAHRLSGQAYKRTGHDAEAEREFAIFKQCQKDAADALERERREQRQFQVILQDRSATTSPR